MKHLIGVTTFLSAMAICSGSASANPIPSLVGTWKGTTHSIMIGSDSNLPGGRGTWNKPDLYEKIAEFTVTNQQGRRYWGSHIVDGKAQGSFIGVINTRGTESYAVDGDGTIISSILGPDLLEVCYIHEPDDARASTPSAVVGCTVFTRQK